MHGVYRMRERPEPLVLAESVPRRRTRRSAGILEGEDGATGERSHPGSANVDAER